MDDKNVNSELQEVQAQNDKVKKPKKEKKPKSIGRELFEWAYSIAIAVIIAFLIKGFLFDIVKVDGNSMFPTLEHANRLIVSKLNYEPEVGDIIILDARYKEREAYFDKIAEEKGVEELSGMQKFMESFSLPDEYKKVYYVKRIIATEGQTVKIENGRAYVDEKEVESGFGNTYITDSAVTYPFTVSEGCVFVLGDNREHSSDSRIAAVGEIPEEAILGKAQLRVWPLDAIGHTK